MGFKAEFLDDVILKQNSTTTIPLFQQHDDYYYDVFNVPSSRIFDTQALDKECHGSVRLSKDKQATKDTDFKPSIEVTKVLVEGCGCFKLYSRKGGRGRSFFLSRAGEWLISMKVASVKKVSC